MYVAQSKTFFKISRNYEANATEFLKTFEMFSHPSVIVRESYTNERVNIVTTKNCL